MFRAMCLALSIFSGVWFEGFVTGLTHNGTIGRVGGILLGIMLTILLVCTVGRVLDTRLADFIDNPFGALHYRLANPGAIDAIGRPYVYQPPKQGRGRLYYSRSQRPLQYGAQ